MFTSPCHPEFLSVILSVSEGSEKRFFGLFGLRMTYIVILSEAKDLKKDSSGQDPQNDKCF